MISSKQILALLATVVVGVGLLFYPAHWLVLSVEIFCAAVLFFGIAVAFGAKDERRAFWATFSLILLCAMLCFSKNHYSKTPWPKIDLTNLWTKPFQAIHPDIDIPLGEQQTAYHYLPYFGPSSGPGAFGPDYKAQSPSYFVDTSSLSYTGYLPPTYATTFPGVTGFLGESTFYGFLRVCNLCVAMVFAQVFAAVSKSVVRRAS